MSDFLKGRNFVIVPRVTTIERNALTATNGMLVYDTDLNAFYKYENGAWGAFAGGSAAWGSITGTLSNQTDLQNALNAKQNTLTNPVTGTGTNNEIAAFNSTGSTITSLSTSTYPTLTELSYVKGVTSAIQTQLDAKEPTITWAQGDLLYGTGANTYAKLSKNTTATRYLSNTGTNNNPAWSQIDLSNGVTGILPSANGGSSAWVDYSGSTTVTGFSSTTTTRVWYQINYKAVTVFFFIIGTSNATTLTFTLPTAHTSNYNGTYIGSFSRNNGISLTTPPGIVMSASSTTVDLYRDIAQTAWTNSGDKRCAGSFTYQID